VFDGLLVGLPVLFADFDILADNDLLGLDATESEQ